MTTTPREPTLAEQIDQQETFAKFVNEWPEQYSPHDRRHANAMLASLRALSAAQGEIARLKRLYEAEHELHKQNGYGYQERIRSLEAELEAAKLNERRYLWLREHAFKSRCIRGCDSQVEAGCGGVEHDRHRG